jgi:hypothetical protein
MKITGLFEGLSSFNKTLIFGSFVYSTVVAWVAYSYHKEEKRKQHQDFVDMYRSTGHYRHPWIENPSEVPEVVKKTDYPKLVEIPKNSVLY